MEMKKQYGQMTGPVIAILIIVALIGTLALVSIASYISAANYGNRTEIALKAKKENNKNIFATYGQKVLEIAQVPDMMRDDILKVTTAAISGRYGADGSKAAWQMIKEQNPQLDPSLYRKIQQVIESGRDEFKNGQQGQIDLKRSYETALGSVWQGLWLKFAGYPRMNLAEFNIVSSTRADEVFLKGKEDGPIQLRK
jgi:uncharacterized protein (UPF0333 family)